MPDVEFSANHALDIEEARKRLQDVGAELDRRYGIRSTWNGNTCHLSGTGIKHGVLRLSDSSVSIEINLAFLAKPLASKIRNEIGSRFTEFFSS